MRANGLVLGAIILASASVNAQTPGCASGNCGPSGCYGPQAQCNPCNSGWTFDFGFGSGSGCGKGGSCATGKCGGGLGLGGGECGPECQAFKRLIGWAFYRPLCPKSSCGYKNCCHPPLYALFPCAPNVGCPCDKGCHTPAVPAPVVGTPTPATPANATPAPAKGDTTVPAVPSVPTTPSTAAPAEAGPVVQTALYNKASGATTAQQAPPSKRVSTYDPKRIAGSMPALNPNQFRRPIAPNESCPK